jgi:hypothetical protein
LTDNHAVRNFSFNPPVWTGEAKLIGELWQLRKRGRRALCTLWNHPSGAEIRLDVEGRDRSWTLVSRDLEPLLDLADAWREALVTQNNWVGPTSSD